MRGEAVWRGMCVRWGFEAPGVAEGGRGKGRESRDSEDQDGDGDEPLEALEHLAAYPLDPALQWLARRARPTSTMSSSSTSSQGKHEHDESGFSWRTHFAREYTTCSSLSSPCKRPVTELTWAGQ